MIPRVSNLSTLLTIPCLSTRIEATPLALKCTASATIASQESIMSWIVVPCAQSRDKLQNNLTKIF